MAERLPQLLCRLVRPQEPGDEGTNKREICGASPIRYLPRCTTNHICEEIKIGGTSLARLEPLRDRARNAVALVTLVGEAEEMLRVLNLAAAFLLVPHGPAVVLGYSAQ